MSGVCRRRPLSNTHAQLHAFIMIAYTLACVYKLGEVKKGTLPAHPVNLLFAFKVNAL